MNTRAHEPPDPDTLIDEEVQFIREHLPEDASMDTQRAYYSDEQLTTAHVFLTIRGHFMTILIHHIGDDEEEDVGDEEEDIRTFVHGHANNRSVNHDELAALLQSVT